MTCRRRSGSAASGDARHILRATPRLLLARRVTSRPRSLAMTDTSLHVTCVGTCVACGRIVDVYVRWDGSERVEAHDGCSGAGSSPRGRLPLPR